MIQHTATRAGASIYYRCNNERCGWHGPSFDLKKMGSIDGPAPLRHVCPRCQWSATEIEPAAEEGDYTVEIGGVEFEGCGGRGEFDLQTAHLVDAGGEFAYEFLSEATPEDLHRLLAYVPPQELAFWIMGQVRKRDLRSYIEEQGAERCRRSR